MADEKLPKPINPGPADNGWPNLPGDRDLERTIEFVNDARIELGQAEESFPSGIAEFANLMKTLQAAHLEVRTILGALLVLEREGHK